MATWKLPNVMTQQMTTWLRERKLSNRKMGVGEMYEHNAEGKKPDTFIRPSKQTNKRMCIVSFHL